MASSKLTTRLVKELKRSPKKTAVLALMFVVALWFWAPLAWKWLAPQSSNAAATTSAATVPSVAPAVESPSHAGETKPDVTAMGWRELATLLESDPLLASARMHEKLADPFAQPTDTAESKPDTDEPNNIVATTIEQPKLTPEQLGLMLASTITGGQRAVATINGRSCRQGDVIVVPGSGVDFEFTVVDIGPGEVKLASNGETHTLKTKRPDSTMKLTPSGSGDAEQPQSNRQRVVIGVQLGE